MIDRWIHNLIYKRFCAIEISWNKTHCSEMDSLRAIVIVVANLDL